MRTIAGIVGLVGFAVCLLMLYGNEPTLPNIAYAAAHFIAVLVLSQSLALFHRPEATPHESTDIAASEARSERDTKASEDAINRLRANRQKTPS